MVTSTELLSALRVSSLKQVEVAGLSLWVRGVNGAERKLIIDRARADNPVQAWELVAMCACNERGDPLFSAEQTDQLAQVDAAALEEIGAAVLAASKLLPESQEQAAKN